MRAALRQFGRLLAEAAASLVVDWRSFLLAFAAIVSAVFVLGAFLMVSRSVEHALTRWAAAAELSVFMDDEVSDAARDAVVRTLRADPVVTDVTIVSPDEARRRFTALFPDLAPLMADASAGALPASLEVRLAAEAPLAQVTALADRLRAQPGVADVRLDQDLLVRVSALARVGRLVGGLLSAILMLAAAVAILSVVRLSYVSRRDEVEIQYLLGAPLSAIRGPFIVEGALQAFLGAAAALLLLVAAHAAVVRRYGAELGGVVLQSLSPWTMLILVSGAIGLGAWAGFAAVRRERGGQVIP